MKRIEPWLSFGMYLSARGLSPNTISTILSFVRRIRRELGDCPTSKKIHFWLREKPAKQRTPYRAAWDHWEAYQKKTGNPISSCRYDEVGDIPDSVQEIIQSLYDLGISTEDLGSSVIDTRQSPEFIDQFLLRVKDHRIPVPASLLQDLVSWGYGVSVSEAQGKILLPAYPHAPKCAGIFCSPAGMPASIKLPPFKGRDRDLCPSLFYLNVLWFSYDQRKFTTIATAKAGTGRQL